MYDAGKVIAGLLIALVLFTLPVLYHVVSGESVAIEKLELGVPEGVTECVRSADFMRREHMHLLVDWRDAVVREGKRIDEESGFRMSLTATCLGCHQKSQEFCFRCHEFSGVKTPYCWECHVDPTGSQ